jgi:hypothetical protein
MFFFFLIRMVAEACLAVKGGKPCQQAASTIFCGLWEMWITWVAARDSCRMYVACSRRQPKSAVENKGEYRATHAT